MQRQADSESVRRTILRRGPPTRGREPLITG